jgi:tetratricopeptide (TPR) repeat protein
MFFVLTFCFQGSDAFAQSNEKKATKRYNEATQLYSEGLRAEALIKLDDAIRIDAEFFDAFMLKGQIFAELKEWQKGVGALNRAFEIAPMERARWQEFLISMCHRGGMHKRSLSRTRRGRKAQRLADEERSFGKLRSICQCCYRCAI